MSDTSHTIHWPRLVIGFLLSGTAALSVHAVMLQWLDVPFPDLSLITPPFKFLIKTIATLALIFLWQFAGPKAPTSFVKRWGILFLIAGMLNETLLRAPFMAGYCTTAWVFAFVGNIAPVLTVAVSSALVVAATPRLSLLWHKALAAVAITAVTLFIASPLIAVAMGPVMASIADLAPQGEWCVLPYGANVLIPAYLSFAEPVVACLAAAALTWDRLSPARALRFAQFALMIVAIKNQLLMPFVYAMFAKLPVLDALTSESQFAFEALVLAVATGATWEWSVGRRA